MRYLLVVGFFCNVYRKEPQARLFVGEKLIDEFNIKNSIDKDPIVFEFYKDYHTLQPCNREKMNQLEIDNMPTLRFYEIDVENKQNLLELRIDINNNDNNYNNGFMTKSTTLKLRFFSFFPLDKKLLLRLNKIMKKNRFNENYAWYHRNNNSIFDLTTNFQWKEEKNKQIFTNTNNYFLNRQYVGGSGSFKCTLVKKYGIFISKLFQSCRYTFKTMLIDYFTHKYKQHANQ